MSRITLSIEEMNHMLREEMRKHEECAKVALKSVYWQEPDTTGCNWDVNLSDDNVSDALACRNCIIDAVRDFRARYNIVAPE